MQVIKTIKAGAKGSRRFTELWGHQLVAVRYRKDERKARTLTTVEIIVDERPFINAPLNQQGFLAKRNADAVAVQIDFNELELRNAVKAVGARWSQAGRLWMMRYDDAARLGLSGRVIEDGVGRCTDLDPSVVLK